MKSGKWMIASDIHGSAYYCRKLCDAFEKEQAEKLLLLGDLLYHGPRNDLPRDYAPKEVFAMLNGIADRIVAVRGNCDSEVDQMVLQFPMMTDYAIVETQGLRIFATHGHLYHPEQPPLLHEGDYLLCGHTHVAACDTYPHFTYLNPGSVSIPKDGIPGYMTLQNGIFSFWNLETGEKVR